MIQTEWSLHQDVFDQICHRWHRPQIDLFATKYNKLPRFVSLVLDQRAWAVDALSLSFGPICLSPSSSSGQGDQQTTTSKLSQDDFDSPRVAQHAFVLGPSQAVFPGEETLAEHNRWL